MTNTHKSTIEITDYKVFCDKPAEGHGSIGGTFMIDDSGRITAYMAGTYTGYEDDEYGQFTYMTQTCDFGKTWTEPVNIGQAEFNEDPKRETLLLGGFMTAAGTLLLKGFHVHKGKEGSKFYEDPDFRQYDLLIGRREKGKDNAEFRVYPPGHFLGEQFMEAGLQLPDGRLIFAMWGAAHKGDNWQCGVLISDDDGISWKYRLVGHEADPGIRNRPDTPAGYNEQSLFLLPNGKLVSIIRGRDKLAQIEGSPKDTWFSRSESVDRGETWTRPVPVNVPSTGAAGVGLVLPDGSLLHACRVPYSRDILKLDDPALFGLHLARSFDEGRTWTTEKIFQHDPDGNDFDNHYNAMNGQFLRTGPDEYHYIFGQFDAKRRIYRLLAVVFKVS